MLNIVILIRNSQDIHKGERRFCPAVIICAASIAITLAIGFDGYKDVCDRFTDVSVNVIGILLGFVMAMVALIASGDNEGIKVAKDFKLERQCDGKDGKKIMQQVRSLGKYKTAYDMLVVDLTVCTIWNAVSLVAFILVMLLVESGSGIGYWVFAAQLFMVLYCIYLSVINMLQIFNIFSAKGRKNAQ